MPETFDVWTSTPTLVAQGFSPARAGGKPTSSLVVASIERVVDQGNDRHSLDEKARLERTTKIWPPTTAVDLRGVALFEEFLSVRGLRGSTRLSTSALDSRRGPTSASVGGTRRR